MKKRIKAHIRKNCRKCGTLLVNKPEYGAVCPKCGWCRGWWTDKDEVATKLQVSCKERSAEE
jgi:Zn-finger nucleic acid-binding protein